jgi:hypothetical protein
MVKNLHHICIKYYLCIEIKIKKMETITIYNTNNLNKKNWERIIRHPNFGKSEREANPGCTIIAAPYKAYSEAKINRMENERKNEEEQSHKFETDVNYRRKCEEYVENAWRRQMPSSMR